MPTVSKGRLKGRVLECFREVERTRVPLIVTDRGREVLEVRSIARAPMTAADVLSEYRRAGKAPPSPSEESLITPLPPEDWEAMGKDDRNPW